MEKYKKVCRRERPVAGSGLITARAKFHSLFMK